MTKGEGRLRKVRKGWQEEKEGNKKERKKRGKKERKKERKDVLKNMKIAIIGGKR